MSFLIFKHVFAYLKVTVSAKQFKENKPSNCTLDKTGLYIDSDGPISVYNSTYNMDTKEITHNGSTDNTRMFFLGFVCVLLSDPALS